MYVVSNAVRVYFSFFLLLCAAFFSAPTLANDGYWSTNERRFIPQSEVNSRVNGILNGGVKTPSGSTTSTLPTPPTYSKNAAGGLSATTESVIKNMGQPSTYSSTINNSLNSAKTALKSCVRSSACAGRALGTGAVIYEGIQGWKNVYSYIYDQETNQLMKPTPLEDVEWIAPPYPDYIHTSVPYTIVEHGTTKCPASHPDGIVARCIVPDNYVQYSVCPRNHPYYTDANFVGIAIISGSWRCQYALDLPPWEQEIPYLPVTLTELDQAIDDSYLPSVSDAPIVLLSGAPDSITLTTPTSAELPSTTTTSTNSNSETTTSITNKTINYTVLNNNTSSPTINSSVVETTTTYDTNANLTNTAVSTTTAQGVQQDVPVPSASSAVIDFELPPFCSWASIVCDWIGWTTEDLEEEEPDLSSLITEFEPDEDEFNLGIGAGTCPAPIQLNITFIDKTVEVSYQPFCDFVIMIRPFILAAAYLFVAYMYLGVLKRG